MIGHGPGILEGDLAERTGKLAAFGRAGVVGCGGLRRSLQREVHRLAQGDGLRMPGEGGPGPLARAQGNLRDGLLLGADAPGPSVLSLQPPAASASRTSSETAVVAGRVDVLMAREIPSWGLDVA